jgi:hypothetical protein
MSVFPRQNQQSVDSVRNQQPSPESVARSGIDEILHIMHHNRHPLGGRRGAVPQNTKRNKKRCFYKTHNDLGIYLIHQCKLIWPRTIIKISIHICYVFYVIWALCCYVLLVMMVLFFPLCFHIFMSM